MQKTLGLAGRKILVTGASGFLGKKIISALENEAVRVIGVDIAADGDVKNFDISDKDLFKDFAEVVYGDDKFIGGHLDGIVNNAAKILQKPASLVFLECFQKRFWVKNREDLRNCYN